MQELLLECNLDCGRIKTSLSVLPDGAVLAESQGRETDVEALKSLTLLTGTAQSSEILESFGRRMADLVMPAPIAPSLAERLAAGPCQIRLRIDANIADVPFEAAFLSEKGVGFLALHPNARLCRDDDSWPRLERTAGRLSVLVANANPQSREYADIPFAGQELASVVAALDAPECRGCRVRTLEHATPGALQRELEEHEAGVFHFIGHGDVSSTGGVLVLEGAHRGEHALLYGDLLSEGLGQSGTCFVVLSACRSGGAAASVGAELCRAGIPAVVAMQSPIGDASAHLFSRALYAALAQGQVTGRFGVAGTLGHQRLWKRLGLAGPFHG